MRSVKAIVDTLLLAGIAVMGVTGIGMYLSPPGRIAKAAHWTYLGLDRHTLGNVHTYFGFAMLIIASIHITLNWKPLKTLLKNTFGNASEVVKVVATFVLLFIGLEIYLIGSG